MVSELSLMLFIVGNLVIWPAIAGIYWYRFQQREEELLKQSEGVEIEEPEAVGRERSTEN